jgi:hypothetical protein
MREMNVKVLILLMAAVLLGACSHVVREARIDFKFNQELSALSAKELASVNGSKTIEVNVSSEVKESEEEVKLLKCLLIGKLQENGWDPKVTLEESKECNQMVETDPGLNSLVLKSYACKPYACKPSEFFGPPTFQVEAVIKKLKKVSPQLRFAIGVFAGRAETEVETIISIVTDNKRIALVKADIKAKAPTRSYPRLFSMVVEGLTGSTPQAINEAAEQIIIVINSKVGTAIGKSD